MENYSLIIIGIAFGTFAVLLLRKQWHNFRLRRKMARARQGETDALHFLAANGFELLATQKRLPLITYLDDEAIESYVRADYLVRRDGRTYVVEVKTGQEAPKVTTAATRRQLLEYYFAYQPDGILLLDMTHHQLQEVRFAVPPAAFAGKTVTFAWRDCALGFCLGASLVYILLAYFG